jgi:para-nitrobenzyl esterase
VNLHIRDLPWTDTDVKVAEIASSSWTNFAKTGDPNGAGLPHWAVYDAEADQLMNLGDKPRSEAVPDEAGLEFLASWDQHFRAMAPAEHKGQ